MAGGDEKLNLDITAKDSASKVLDPLAKKVDKLEESDPTVEVDADTKAADDDVETFAKKLAGLTTTDQIVLLSLKAGAAQSELTQLATDIAQLDASDPNIDVKIDRFNEVSGELEQIEGKIKAVADADPDAKQHLEQARSKLQRMGEESGKAGDAVHSMAGNAVGDLAATAAGVGPVGEAIGQLTEGVLGGEIAFSQLAKAAVGVGAITAAVLVVNSIVGTFQAEAKRAAEIEAFNVKNAEEFAKWAAQGKDAVEEYTNSAREAGKLEVAPDVDDFNAALEKLGLLKGSLSDTSDALRDMGKLELHGIKDLTKDLDAAGIKAKDFLEAAAPGNQAGFDALVETIKSSGVPLKEQATLIASLTYQQEQFASGAQDAATKLAVFGDGADSTAAGVEALQKATDEMRLSQDIAARSAQEHTDRLNEQAAALEADKQAQEELTDAMRSAADAAFDVDDKTVSWNESLATLDKRLTDAGTDTAKHKKVLDDTARSAADLADANVHLADQTAQANGQTLTATQRTDAWNSSMLRQAGQLKGESRQAVLDYIASVNGIPPEKITDINALLDQGDIAGAEQALADVSRSRTTSVKADADNASLTETNRQLDQVAKDRTATVRVRYDGDAANRGAHAAGGTVGLNENESLVGEDGPEIARFPPGTQITPAHQTAKRLGGAGTVNNYYTTVNVGPGQAARDIEALNRLWTRRNGTGDGWGLR